MLRHIDASAVLDLWEHYPLVQFPAVWEWIESEFVSGSLEITRVALDEVGFRDTACKAHLETCRVVGLPVGNAEMVAALGIKSALRIVNDEYGSGVDENDIFIIASAKVRGVELVTNEALQPRLPALRKNYKIPAVCAVPGVQVVSMRLIDYIRQSERIFR